jgi:hypothetical protein
MRDAVGDEVIFVQAKVMVLDVREMVWVRRILPPDKFIH